MNKSKKLPIIIALILLGVLAAAAIGLFIAETAHNAWVVDKADAVKFGILMVGIGLTFVRLIGNVGGPSLRRIEKAFAKEIGSAFSAPDQKRQRKALLTAIERYNRNKFNGAVTRLIALRRECRTSDDYNAVLLFLALTYTDAGCIEDAIATYEELVKFSPAHSTAWSNLGLLYRKQGNFDKAIACYENGIKYDEQNPYAWNNLAIAHLSASNWQKVIAPALHAVSIKADMYQAEAALCVAYFAMGDKQNSKKYFDSAVLHGEQADKLRSVLQGLEAGTVAFTTASGVREEIERANGHLQRDTALPMVEIRLPAPEDGNRSRLGGAPVDKDAPLDSTGAPMKLLAAIWCSEVRGVPDFPARGVLRFYVADNDVYGADFDHPNVQSDFRVLYDEDESAFDSRLADDPALSEYFPIRHVLPVRLTPAMGSIRASDDGFEQCVNAALRKVGIDQDFGELSDEESDYLYEQNTYAGHRIGGYPCFEQFDPRYKPELQKYDTLLLQIVSHTAPDGHGHEQELIMFGDEGGCQFFIPAEKLRARDFSDVMYTWDCG
ncbi:MAG: DUF1963 domain-containing protein [Ruminococcaceae bacterium]|nr:DUF1963 domain-containing protein [Oscillospiraceae bacterium]